MQDLIVAFDFITSIAKTLLILFAIPLIIILYRVLLKLDMIENKVLLGSKKDDSKNE